MKKTRIFHAGLEWFNLLLVLNYVLFGTRYGHFIYRILLLCSLLSQTCEQGLLRTLK